MLTSGEKANLEAAWKRLDAGALDKSLHCAVPQQGEMMMKTTSNCGCLPTFTTVDYIWKRDKKRWLTGLEKLTALGFAATPAISKAYGVVAR